MEWEDPTRETVTGIVADSAAAEEAVARLVRLAGIDAGSGGIDVVIEAIGDDPATPIAESGVSLRAEVPADKAAAARAALSGDGVGGKDGEGGI